eukprot:TRINITY_DN36_c0_g2_i2.p2 TRINITY_DN36_c0_g2~~TRINITY_DN36_c0_g2_i2.p2  ORF type:complete len:696 (+),score=86.35 TRINITY_DN36_c0_g2_i2:1799-3886(+)
MRSAIASLESEEKEEKKSATTSLTKSCMEQILDYVSELHKIAEQDSTRADGAYEIEIRFKLPEHMDAGKLVGFDIWKEVERYTETIYPYESPSRIKVRARDHEIIEKSKVTSRKFPEIMMEAVMSFERGTVSKPRRRKIKECRYTRYTAKMGKMMLDLKHNEDTKEFRLELEIYGESKDNIGKMLTLVTCELQRSNLPLSMKEMETLRSMLIRPSIAYGRLDLTRNKCPNPKHLDMGGCREISELWSVTEKLDGVRRFVCLTPTGAYSIDRSMRIEVLSRHSRGDNYICLFDSELVSGAHNLFDTLVFMNKDVCGESLEQRLGYCKTMEAYEGFKTKRFAKNIGEVIGMIEKDKTCDGVIIANDRESYGHTQYKIKKETTYDLELKGSSLRSSDGVEYKNWDSNDVIRGDGIYEMTARGGRYAALRKRDDKTEANHSSVIEAMGSSITIKGVVNHQFKIMRKYHNRVKRDLIESAREGREGLVLLDVGTGRGGDCNKWGKYKTVYCVEPREDNIRKIQKRSKDEKKHKIIKAKARDYEEVAKSVKEKVSVVTIFFSFMMFEEEDIKGLLKIIDGTSATRCTVQIITTDLERMTQKVPKENMEYKNGYVIRREKGKKIRFTVPGSNVKENEEYINDTKAFKEGLRSMGFRDTMSNVHLENGTMLYTQAREMSSLFAVSEMKRSDKDDEVHEPEKIF